MAALSEEARGPTLNMTARRIPAREWAHKAAEFLHTFPDNHPIQIALRTYALALSLSLGPAFVAFLTKPRRKTVGPLIRAIQRELGLTGFAFAMTTALAGGASFKSLWDSLEEKFAAPSSSRLSTWRSRLRDVHKTFLANACSAFIAIMLMQRQRAKLRHIKVHFYNLE